MAEDDRKTITIGELIEHGRNLRALLEMKPGSDVDFDERKVLEEQQGEAIATVLFEVAEFTMLRLDDAVRAIERIADAAEHMAHVQNPASMPR